MTLRRDAPGVIEHPVDEPPGARVQLHVLDDQPQLLGRVQHLRLRDRRQPEQAQHQPGRGLEHPVDREAHQVEGAEREHRPHRDRLRALDGDGLGGELAEHRVQEGDEDEADGGAQRVQRGRRVDAGADEPGAEQSFDRRLAQPAQRQRREGDPQLAGRQVGGELLRDAEQDAGPVPSGARQLLEPRGPDLHERELRRDEEGVGQDHHRRDEEGDRRVHGPRGSHSVGAESKRVRVGRLCRPTLIAGGLEPSQGSRGATAAPRQVPETLGRGGQLLVMSRGYGWN